MEHFREIKDPRIERRKRRNLLDIIAMSICASLGGADNWCHVALFSQGNV